jgi:hypothetical protein
MRQLLLQGNQIISNIHLLKDDTFSKIVFSVQRTHSKNSKIVKNNDQVPYEISCYLFKLLAIQ